MDSVVELQIFFFTAVTRHRVILEVFLFWGLIFTILGGIWTCDPLRCYSRTIQVSWTTTTSNSQYVYVKNPHNNNVHVNSIENSRHTNLIKIHYLHLLAYYSWYITVVFALFGESCDCREISSDFGPKMCFLYARLPILANDLWIKYQIFDRETISRTN